MIKFEPHETPNQKQPFSLSLIPNIEMTTEVSNAMLKKAQMQYMDLLADRIKEYLHGDSTSLREETAQTIMASNFYTVDLYLKSCRNQQTDLSKLNEVPISELYARGSVLLYKKIKQAKRLLSLAKKSKLKTINTAYNDTLQNGIALFFTSYSPQYEAHETPALVDYPPALPLNGLSGIEYINAYLEALCAENLFCNRFSAKVIHEVLYGYNKNYHQLLFNLFEQVLTNALGVVLLKKDIYELDIQKKDLTFLQTLFKDKSEQEILSILQLAAYGLLRELTISGPGLKAYISKNLNQLATKIHFYMGIDKLQIIFVPKRSRPTSAIIHFNMGEKMDDEQYRDLIDEIHCCRHADDKLRIVRQNIKSLADMEDVLRDADLTEEEELQILRLLSDTELAVLLRRNPPMKEIDAMDFSENELKLQHSLQIFFVSLPKEHQTQILELARQIREF